MKLRLKVFINRISKDVKIKNSRLSEDKLVNWLLRFDTEEKKQLFLYFLNEIEETGVVDYNISEELHKYINGNDINVCDEFKKRALNLFSIDFVSTNSCSSFYISNSGIFVDLDEVNTDVFNEYNGEYGLGDIFISNLIMYRYEVVKNICSVSSDYNESIEGYDLFIISLIDTIDYCLPAYGDKSWSKESDLSIGKEISSIFIKTFKGVSSGVYRLYMDGDKLSFTKKDVPFKYVCMLAELLINNFSDPIKEAYFVLSLEEDFSVNNYIFKRCNDGEITVVLY